jgi:hypothetical protein
MDRRGWLLVLAAVGLGTALWVWSGRYPPEEREIRARLDEFTRTFNAAAQEGLAGLAHAARLGQFFTHNVVVELGQGSPPIEGRDTLVGMAARLQPRTAEYRLEIADLHVDVRSDHAAEVALTAVLHRRSRASAGDSLDAREFAAEVTKEGGVWRVSRVIAVDTLR